MDTVVIRLNNYRINLNYDRDTWNMRKFASTKNNFVKIENRTALAKFEYVLTPKLESSRQRYYPQITQKLNQEGKCDIEIQASIPKLLYGTNLFEVDFTLTNSAQDIYNAFHQLTKSLFYPEPTIDAFKQSQLIRIDLAKNIILEGKDIVNDLLQEVNKFSLSSSLNVREVRYKPNNKDGRAVNFWNTGQSYCLYNKILEIQSIDPKKATSTVLEVENLLTKCHLEVLRLERRLQTPEATKIILGRYIGSDYISLQSFLECKYNISKLLIKDMVRDFRINNLDLFTSQPIQSDSLAFIRQSFEKNSFSQVARSYLMREILKELGIEKGWEYIEQITSERSTRNYKHDLRKSDFKLYSPSVNDVFTQLDEQIEKFEPFTKDKLFTLCREDEEEAK